MKQQASFAAPLKNIWNLDHYYLKNYLTIGELQIFQPFVKMAINQNFASQFDFTYYQQTHGKRVKDYLLDHFGAITSSAIRIFKWTINCYATVAYL